MNGRVDDDRRALRPITIRASLKTEPTSVEAWIDTAFDGHFVFPSGLIKDLELGTLVETEAILADGTKVTLETFVAYLDWFGDVIPVQVIHEGQFPLLGTALLEDRLLAVDYKQSSVLLS